MDQKPKICPLCGLAPLKFLAMNLTEKVLMCANNQCDFPFGYEELQIITVKGNESKASSIDGLNSQLSKIAQSLKKKEEKKKEKKTKITTDAATASTSTATKTKTKKNKYLRKAAKLNRMKKDLDTLRKFATEISQQNEDTTIIENKDYLKKLVGLQGSFGKQLISYNEINQIEVKKEPEGGVTIDAEPNNDGLLDIKVEYETTE